MLVVVHLLVYIPSGTPDGGDGGMLGIHDWIFVFVVIFPFFFDTICYIKVTTEGYLEFIPTYIGFTAF